MADAVVLGTLIGLSLAPPLLMALWVRNLERHGKEPVGAILGAFGFGATLGVAISFVLNTLFDTAATRFAADIGVTSGVLTAVVAAPVVEEAAKGLGMRTRRAFLLEPEDGFVYGAAIGLGFAATENLLYGATALLEGGVDAALGVLVMRILSSTILHAGASAILGFGIGLAVLRLRGTGTVLGAYLVAVLLHAGYNLLAVLESWVAFLAALILVWVVFGKVRRRIEDLDAHPPEPPAHF